MDYEKPEVVAIHVNESLEESSRPPLIPDIEYAATPTPNQPSGIDDAKERRGVRLWYA
jgi:hypothetical protein